MKRKAPKRKRFPISNLVFVCPCCCEATVLKTPIPAIQYGMSRVVMRKPRYHK